MFFFGSSTTYSISAFLGWNSTHLMVNPLNEQRCGVYPSCVDHFPTDTMAFPWLFHISVSLPHGNSLMPWGTRGVSWPSIPLSKPCHSAGGFTGKPSFFGGNKMVFSASWNGKMRILGKNLMGRDGPTIQPLTLVYLVSGRFILRLGKSSNFPIYLT